MKSHSYINSTEGREPRGRNPNTRWQPILADLLVLAVLLGGGSFAFGQSIPDLFTAEVLPSDTEVSEADAALMHQAQVQEQQEPTIRRSRHVKANVRGLAVLNTEGTVGLNLFDDVYLTLIIDRVDMPGAGQYTVHGRIAGAEMSGVTIVVENDVMVGNIHADGHLYQIQSIGNGVQAIQEMDASALPEHSDPIPVDLDSVQVEKQALVDDGQETEDNGEAGEVIDVMVVYTPAVLARTYGAENMKALIQLAIDETNEAYANSQIKQRVRLVHLAMVEYQESGSLQTDLNCVTFPRNEDPDYCIKDENQEAMEQVQHLRNTYGADLVSLWVHDLDIIEGGLAKTLGKGKPVTQAFAPYAFNVLDWRTAIFPGYWAFAHELGHNMGAHHDRQNAKGTAAYPYSYGLQNPDNGFRTIMAYPCPEWAYLKIPRPCPTIQHFSNPEVQYNGVETGIAVGEANAADNSKTLNNTRSVVGGFRQTKVFAPPPILSPTPGGTLTQTTMTFTGGHVGTGVFRHWIYVGNSKGTFNLKNQYLGTNSSVTVSGLPFTGTIYVRYWTELVQGWQYQDHTYTMKVPNSPPTLISPAPGGTLLTTTVTFTGGHTSGDLQHWLYVGTAKGTSNIKSQNLGSTHSVSVSGLPTSGTIYVRYWTRFASGWKFQDHTYGMQGQNWNNGGAGVLR